MIYAIIYVIGIILYAIIGSLLFEPIEGDYEIVCGEPVERDEFIQQLDMITRAFIWPVAVGFLILISPILLIQKLSDFIIKKKKEKQNTD